MYTKEILSQAHGFGIDVVEPCDDASWDTYIAEDVTKYILDEPKKDVLSNLAQDICRIRNPMYKPFVSLSVENSAVVLTESISAADDTLSSPIRIYTVEHLNFRLVESIENSQFLEKYFNSDLISDDEDSNLYHFSEAVFSFFSIKGLVLEEYYPKYVKLFAKELKDDHLKKNFSFSAAKRIYNDFEDKDDEVIPDALKMILGLSHWTLKPYEAEEYQEFDVASKIAEDNFQDIESQLSDIAKKYKQYGLRRPDKELLELSNGIIWGVANEIARYLVDSKYGKDCTVEVSQNEDREASVYLKNWGEWVCSKKGCAVLAEEPAVLVSNFILYTLLSHRDMDIKAVEGKNKQLYINLSYKD